MSIIVVSTQNTEKEFQQKGLNFGELIDELESSAKFSDFQFVYNGTLLTNIAKGTKIANISQGQGGRIEIQRKQQQGPDNQSSKIISNNPPKQNSFQTTNTPIVEPQIFQQDQKRESNQQSDQTPQQNQQIDDVWATRVQQAQQQTNQQNSQIQQNPQNQTGQTLKPAVFTPTAPLNAHNPFAPVTTPFAPPNAPKPLAGAPLPSSFVQVPSTFVPVPPIAPKAFVPITKPNPMPPQQLHQNPPPVPQISTINPIIQQAQPIRKEVKYREQINDEQKIINDFRVKITDKGNRVELDSEKYDMKAVFLEENANEKIQGEIKKQLTKDAYPQDVKFLVKCLVGDQNQSTKVIFKKSQDGIAIQWATGLITLFEFELAI